MNRLKGLVLDLLSRHPQYPSITALLRAQPHIASSVASHRSSLPINVSHAKVRKERIKVPRPGVPYTERSSYNKFLRELYPLTGSHVNHGTLFGAYAALPKPQALHVSPEHFEDLLSRFGSAEGSHGRKMAAGTFERVVNGMNKCGLPLSEKELNTMLYLKYYDESNVGKIRAEWEIVKSGMKDVSTANVFLKFAVRFDDFEFVKEITTWMKEEGIKMDRVSYDCLLRYLGAQGLEENVVALLKEMMADGIVIDITVLNSIMRILVKNGDVHGAYDIVRKMMEMSGSQSQEEGARERRSQLAMMKYLDTLKLQPGSSLLCYSAPTFDTFKPLLDHFTSIGTFDPSQVSYIFQLMLYSNVHVPSKYIKRTLTTFRERDVPITDQLELIAGFLSGNKLKLDRSLYEALLSTCQKQTRHKSDSVNDIAEGWTPQSRKPKNEIEVDVERLAEHSIGKLVGLL